MTFQPLYQKKVINYPEITCKNCPHSFKYKNKKFKKREIEIYRKHIIIPKLIIIKVSLIITKAFVTYYENAKDYVWCNMYEKNVNCGFAFICPFYQEFILPLLVHQVNKKRNKDGRLPKIVGRDEKCKRKRGE